MIGTHPFKVTIHYQPSHKRQPVSREFTTLPAALAMIEENKGKAATVKRIELHCIIHEHVNPTVQPR